MTMPQTDDARPVRAPDAEGLETRLREASTYFRENVLDTDDTHGLLAEAADALAALRQQLADAEAEVEAWRSLGGPQRSTVVRGMVERARTPGEGVSS